MIETAEVTAWGEKGDALAKNLDTGKLIVLKVLNGKEVRIGDIIKAEITVEKEKYDFGTLKEIITPIKRNKINYLLEIADLAELEKKDLIFLRDETPVNLNKNGLKKVLDYIIELKKQ